MSTSVKLSEADKKKLDRLQALVTLKSGRKLSQQELLAALIKEALGRTDDIAQEAAGPHLPVSEADFEKAKALSRDWGVETSWKGIDEVLYGKRRG